MDLNLRNRVALVTGAARDVGREIAVALAAEGAAVAVNYRSSGNEAEAAVEEITAKGAQHQRWLQHGVIGYGEPGKIIRRQLHRVLKGA